MKKRRQKPDKRKKRGRKQEQPIPDRRSMEKMMSDLGHLLQTGEFESIEDANAYLNQLLASGGPLPAAPAETPLEKAQALMYEAWDAQGKKRIQLAKKALELSGDCADAYVLLAEEAARSAEEAYTYFEKGVQAGERCLGAEMFAEEAGHFWGILRTRPYMRARAGLANLSWYLGRRAEAIDHFQEMLRLNPGDNQGVRYVLTNWLLLEKRHAALSDLLQQYEDDASANWAYTGALLTFLQSGDTAEAKLALQTAIQANPHVPDYLLGNRSMPKHMPDYVGFGDENEAVDYVASASQAWVETEGALAWLQATGRQRDRIEPSATPAGTGIDEEPQLDWLMADYDGDDDWDADEDFPPFELEKLLSEWKIPKKEHASIRRCLSVGLGKYYLDIYGYFKYGKQPVHLIEERMHLPYIFGYGAVEVIGHRQISQASKLKICHYLFETMKPGYDSGVPYGLIRALGFMAAEDRLPMDRFLLGTLALEYGDASPFRRSEWMEGATNESLIALADWIAGHQEMESDTKNWWAWKLSINCDHQPHLGKAFAQRWLEKTEIPEESKSALCWAWVRHEKQFGTPPLGWRLMVAQQMGDLEEMKRLLREAGIDPAQMLLPTPEELPSPADVEEDPFLSILRMRQEFVLIPAYLIRLAIPALVRFGEDITDVADALWGENNYYEEAKCNGVADAIEEFHHLLAPETLRGLVERGIEHSKASVRKRYYALSLVFYGEELLERALQDKAKSIQTWATKKFGL